MKLKEIFAKPVDRKIEGVVKADDTDEIRTEVEEYVLTNEIEKRLEEFLDAYNHYGSVDVNGVWISGFFGSGKSHLLKMMALLLENTQVNDRPVVDYFVEKCDDNRLLAAALRKAVSIPSESILFNIDQKADVISKEDVDAVLAVFVKVFDEHCGYYGKQAYIANFERKLDLDGLLDEFKAAFEKHEGQTWEWGCERILRVSSSADKAFNEVTGQNHVGVLKQARDDYRLSIEDFAEQVRDYIHQKPEKFRLNFFVDEVGQYIADNTKLMTNLQTISESLATKCDGQAWIIVTAQEDMHSVLGEMSQHQGNDFTKIQDRFANRMKLTSTDVAEVIQKRLLRKTDTGEGELSVVYDQEQNNFRTLLSFEGGQQYRNYQGKDHFVDCYPFVPYQFELFQLAIRNLSKQNAFEGKHSSVGERSMLGVFQQVAKQIADHQLGEIATFDLMFEGIRSALKSEIQRSILTAENNLDNPLAVRLLKALFLVKYVQEFKANTHNLVVLMLDHFDQDVGQLKKNVEAALTVLDNQVYIQRAGDLYEYLTDEEKDVEQEIKNTEVDSQDVAAELSKIVFDKLIRDKKLRFEDNQQDFPYTRKLDDRIFGREQELAVHVITPFHELSESTDQLKMAYMGRPELLVVLPSDDRVMRDLVQFKKTEKYVTQNVSMTQQASKKRILSEKQIANQHRISEIAENIKSLVGEASLFVAGSAVESGSRDPQRRILDGFHQLIVQTYPNLKMLRGIAYTENQIDAYLHNDGGLFGDDLSEAEMEVFAYINRRFQPPNNLRTSLKDLVENFEKKPFGWPLAAIQCFVASLVNRGKVVIKGDSEVLEGTTLVNALKNTRNHGNYLLEPQAQVSAGRIRKVKEFYEAFFDEPASGNEPKTLGPELARGFTHVHEEVTEFLRQAREFPFLNDLQTPASRLEQLSLKRNYFSDEFEGQLDDLLDLKEDIIEPIRMFMNGSQREIYREAREYLATHESNFQYLGDGKALDLRRVLDDPHCYRGRAMQGVKSQLDSLRQELDLRVESERQRVQQQLEAKAAKLKTIEGFLKLPPEQQSRFESEVSKAIQYASQTPLIAVVKETGNRFEEETWPRLIDQIQQQQGGNGGKGGTTVETINLDRLQVAFDPVFIQSEQDVEAYLAALRQTLLQTVRDGKRVQV